MFRHLFVFGRPGGGKSEFIDFIKRCDPDRRRREFQIASFDLIDDFHFLWEVGENEDIFERFDCPRRFTRTTDDGIVVMEPVFFDFVSEKINRTFQRNRPDREKTLLIEFSRGLDPIMGAGEAGYRRALSLLNREILSPAAILYMKVSFAEALRRNEARYQEKLKHSQLAHKVPEEAMERFYREDDWEGLTGGRDAGLIEVNDLKIPFVTLDNEIESKEDEIMARRYASALERLFIIWSETRRT